MVACLFIDLRDHYGITQVVADPDSAAFATAEQVRSEWVIRVDGKVRERPEGTLNPELPTGEIELFASEIEILSPAKELPVPVFGEPDYPEDLRLQYRFLDLRRETLHANIMQRMAIVRAIREKDARRGLLRVHDADPDGIVARGRTRLSLSPAASIRASSTHCRRRRSSTSNLS